MNGIHDMGGMHGMGPVEPEPNEPVFHAPWEGRVLALNLAMGFHGRWNIDRGRYFRENRHPLDYLSSTYYEIWLKGLEALLVDAGFVRAEELAAGRSLVPPPNDVPRVPGRDEAHAVISKGSSYRRPETAPPRFKVGDTVRVREMTVAGHTRAPRYCRRRRGIVQEVRGNFVFPDTNAALAGENPQALYSVRFEGRELWGDAAGPKDAVYIDLWDDYLEAAT
ncbi:MAG TPA: nitrile hydratase subunit beta [Stellaceae bacterium]|nr:nitrile hydratase subunit beta [Stellaceae bacterium]